MMVVLILIVLKAVDDAKINSFADLFVMNEGKYVDNLWGFGLTAYSSPQFWILFGVSGIGTIALLLL